MHTSISMVRYCFSLYPSQFVICTMYELTFMLERVCGIKFPSTHARLHQRHQMRLFMESIAISFNMDPLIPQTWYSIPLQTVLQSKVPKQVFFWFFSFTTVNFPIRFLAQQQCTTLPLSFSFVN